MQAANGGRPEPWDELLMFLVDADLHGPAVLAIHRLLAGVHGATVLAGLEGDFDSARPALPGRGRAGAGPAAGDAVAFGLYAAGRSWLLVARDPAGLAARRVMTCRMLDVEVLHGPVLSKRLGVSDFEAGRPTSGLAAAVAAVDGGAAANLDLRPAPFGAVARSPPAADPPQKTTYFYPKPRDGLVLRLLDESLIHGDPLWLPHRLERLCHGRGDRQEVRRECARCPARGDPPGSTPTWGASGDHGRLPAGR